MAFLKGIFGDETARFVKAHNGTIERINGLEPEFESLSDEALRAKTGEFRDALKSGKTPDDMLPEAFAAVREAAKRTLGQRHYDVQLLGGIAMHKGSIAEMRTGEGKTLAATLAVYLNALSERGVHVVTVNDYLARRDTAWMGQIYNALGMTVGVINGQNQSFLYDAGHTDVDEERDEKGSFKVFYEFLRPVARPEAYAADITYGTNSEFGFDYLRDNIAHKKDDVAQREHAYAIVDEIDSILIDEARTPLIISMPAAESGELYQQFAGIAARLKEGDHYEVDEKHKSIALSDDGIQKAEELLGIENIYTDAGIKYVHHLETAVRAKANFKRDIDYVVRPASPAGGDREVIIVDQFTGRLQPGRRWSEGLHQAIEAKENVEVKQESRTFASITYQNYFRMYDKLSGMTGTAETSAEEFHKVYGLDTVVIPTHRPAVRADHDDLIFRTREGKFKAVARHVRQLNEAGQPVLLGTVSVEDNEVLSSFLSREGIKHQMLNAKNHEQEAEIIAQAGTRGAVTLATNVAGRGVDIKLGGATATEEEHEEVKKLGGLFVLGTERHEARRIDNQLRGRSGRQGDPGASQFFVSLDDTLMRVFAADTIRGMMERLNVPEDEPIQNRLITRSLESAQRKIEGLNFDARKRILEFDDVLNTQRQSVYGQRKRVLEGDADEVQAVFEEVMGEELGSNEAIAERREALGEEEFNEGVRRLLLQTFDFLWVQHLEMMDYMRSSVSLRAYGQRDPLVEYKKEGLRLFREMQEDMRERVLELVPRLGAGAFAREEERLAKQRGKIKFIDGGGTQKIAPAPAAKQKKIGRNEAVTITNGTETKEMKYKKAEPLLESGEWKLVQ